MCLDVRACGVIYIYMSFRNCKRQAGTTEEGLKGRRPRLQVAVCTRGRLYWIEGELETQRRQRLNLPLPSLDLPTGQPPAFQRFRPDLIQIQRSIRHLSTPLMDDQGRGL